MINKCTYLKIAVKRYLFLQNKDLFINHRDNNQITSFIR